jgi:hypothetical protein
VRRERLSPEDAVMRFALVIPALIACGDDGPCGDIGGTCIEVKITSPTVAAIDQLELDVLFNFRHGTASTMPAEGTVDLPFVTTIGVAITSTSEVGVVAAGKLAGAVLGTGHANAMARPNSSTSIEIVLRPPDACTPNEASCGGTNLAGDPQTLYRCNANGVPRARGKCRFECVERAGDDTCGKGPMTCVIPGEYCGGNELVGDPSTLYVCGTGNQPTMPVPCANGCAFGPEGKDDFCLPD